MNKLFEDIIDIYDDDYIKETCKKYNIINYIINDDKTIDVNGAVVLSGKNLYKIPLKFNRVNSFYCDNNNLTSLENSPIYVMSFDCSHNNLSDLDGGPLSSKTYVCSYNKITTLKYGPLEVESFYCDNNNISNFNDITFKECDQLLYASFNKLKSLENIPYSKRYLLDYNLIKSLKGLPFDIKILDISNNLLNILDFEISIYDKLVLNNNPLPNSILDLKDNEKIEVLKYCVSYEIFNKNGVLNENRLKSILKDSNI